MDDLKNQDMEQTNSEDEEIKDSNKEEQKEESVKKYTDEEVNEIVKNRLSRERRKFNKILDSDEFDKELIEREKALDLREMKADAKDILSENNIPPEFIDLIDFTDRESMENSLKTIENIRDNYITPWITNEVNKRISGHTPKRSSTSLNTNDPIKNAFKL